MKVGTPKGKWLTSTGGLIYVLQGSVVGTVSKSLARHSPTWHAHGCMSDWEDVDLGTHSSKLEARKTVADWVKENQ